MQRRRLKHWRSSCGCFSITSSPTSEVVGAPLAATLAARAHHQHRADVLRLGRVDGTSFLHVRIPSDSSVVGQRISELGLPEECLIVSVRRGHKPNMAHGYTTLESGDRVTVFAGSECVPEVQHLLTGGSAGDAQSSQDKSVDRLEE